PISRKRPQIRHEFSIGLQQATRAFSTVSRMTGERDLARMARLGDRAALELLARRWEGPVYAVCYRFLGRPDEARDAAQEAFRKMTQSMATFDEAREFG